MIREVRKLNVFRQEVKSKKLSLLPRLAVVRDDTNPLSENEMNRETGINRPKEEI